MISYIIAPLLALSVGGPITLTPTLCDGVSVRGNETSVSAIFPNLIAEICSMHFPKLASIFNEAPDISISLHICRASNQWRRIALGTGFQRKLFERGTDIRVRTAAIPQIGVTDGQNLNRTSANILDPHSVFHQRRIGGLVSTDYHYLAMPALGLTIGGKVALGDCCGAPSLSESSPYQPDANRAQNHASNGSDAHNTRPKGGYALSLKIALIAGIGALGFSSFCYALLASDRGDNTTSAQFGVISILLIFLAAFSCLPLIFGLP